MATIGGITAAQNLELERIKNQQVSHFLTTDFCFNFG